MVKAIPDILARIIELKKTELVPVTDALERRATAAANSRRKFSEALLTAPPAIIAEVKKASPSKGLLLADFDPRKIAAAYEQGGAAALSVLTDSEHFQGSLADLEAARGAVRIPALRKDFTIDRSQVVEAAAHGADAILLIAAVLPENLLRDFREVAESYGMDALVEVHDSEELKAAAASGAKIIGVNNRDLRTFEVSLDVALRLADEMPAGIVRVAESGIGSSSDIQLLQAAGFQAFLIGEHLMRAGQPVEALRALRA